MSISQHLNLNTKRSQLLQYVNKREQKSIIRVSQELMRNNKINIFTLEKPKPLSKKYSSPKNIKHKKNYRRKVMHGYFQRKLHSDANINMKPNQYRTKNKTMTPHFAGYWTQ